MTTEYQTVIDYAEQISINCRKKVAQTTSRDGTVKSTSLGGQIWEFEVTMPSGLAWTTFRPLIEQMNYIDRNTVSQIQLNNSGHSWISGYQGNVSNITNIVVSYSSGNIVTITSGATGLSSGQFKFKAGDFIQLGTSGSVYTVASDVAYNANNIVLNRPVREAAGSYTLKVGPAVTWNVICVQFPKWTMFARDQISWDGPFVFAEAI
jgi:hypothetical protein